MFNFWIYTLMLFIHVMLVWRLVLKSIRNYANWDYMYVLYMHYIHMLYLITLLAQISWI